MPDIQQVDKAAPNSVCAKQQKSNSAESADALSRKATPGARSGRRGTEKGNAHVQSDRKDGTEAIPAVPWTDNAVGSRRQAISCSRGNARQSGKGTRLEENATQPAGREKKGAANARQSPGREGSERPKPMNNQM